MWISKEIWFIKTIFQIFFKVNTLALIRVSFLGVYFAVQGGKINNPLV